MSTKTVVRGVLAALASIMVQGLTADEVVVGNLERGVVDVAPETVLTPTRVSEEPEALSLEKLGGGTLAVPFENVLQPTAFKIGVREGSLILSDNGGTPLAITEPPEAMQKAALWLEADKNVEVQDGSVRTWYDSRETKNGDVWGAKYYCATAEKGWDSASYPVLATVGGQTMLNFNGKKSGSYMRFSDTTRTEIGDITDIRHVFVVLDITDSWGFPLGNVGGDAYFHPENNDGTLGAYLSDSSVYPLTLCGRCYLDGVCFDPVATTVKTGRQVLSWEGIKDVTAKVGALFGDRGMWTEQYKRCGGNCIGAVVVFTTQLTVAERTAVEAYLIGKWKGTVRPSGAAVLVASGATATVSAASGLSFAADKSVSVAGSGLVRTDGSGSVRLRASCGQGVPAAVEIGEDSTLVSELGELPLKLSDGDVVTKAQQGFQRTSGASGTVTLEGGIVRPSDLPMTVKSFAADVDELVVGAPDAESAVLANAEVIEATIPDPSFEADYTACNPNTTTTQNGWTFKCGANGYFIFPKPKNPGSDSWAIGTPYPAPDGEKVLVLKHNGECWCTVHVPTNGVYELTFWTCKHDANYQPKPLEVSLEQDEKVWKLGRCWPMCGFGPEQQRYRTDWLEAGDYTLRFSDAVQEDCVHHLDDIHLRLVSDACRRQYAVPNGRFETASLETQRNKTSLKHLFSKSNTIDGWTLTQTADATTAPSVAPVSRYTEGRYRFGRADNGNCQLMFCHNGGVATSPEFTVPAGVWRLKFRAALWTIRNVSAYYWNYKQLTESPILQVKLNRNGSEELTQTFAVNSSVMKDLFCDRVVRVSSGDRLQLSLTQTQASAGLLVDDFVLEECAIEDELLTNTSFEQNLDGWTAVSYADSGVPVLKNSLAARVEVSDGNASWLGGDRADGNAALALVQCGEVSQQVTFTEPGIYRFATWVRARVSNGTTSYGGNRLWAYLVDDQGQTNDVAKTEQLLAKVFVHHSYLFRVGKAGTYTFVMRGMNGMPQPDGTYLNVVPAGCNAQDSWALADGVSIRKATAEELAVDYSLGQAELKLGVATKLRLDFDGTMKVDRLKLGGKWCRGVIDASHPSGLVSGSGKFDVAGRGLFIVVQ